MTIDQVLNELQELKNTRAARINELKHVKTETNETNAGLETELAELMANRETMDPDDITKSIVRQAEIETEMANNNIRVSAIEKQLDYEQNEKDYISLADFGEYQHELETAYNEKKIEIYTKCQELANELTTLGEQLLAAQNDANKAMEIAFNLYHGKTITETRVERVCVGDHIETDNDGNKHKVNDFEDKEFTFEYRVKPTIGRHDDLAGQRIVSETYNTRGKNNWAVFRK